jgi:GTP diphosphokinase / guanosine-3',5'-bis(diphosphate) 3'-diphosphatase
VTDENLEKMSQKIEEELRFFDVDIVRISKRIKHLYSLYQKLKKHTMDIDKIYDIVALRIIVKDIPACYQTLGVIHSMYKPLPGRIKDYISIPKPNSYRSLHTTVFDGNGGTFEIQIRTDEMHKEAEFGVASHLRYKEEKHLPNKQKIREQTDWTKHLLEIQSEVAESKEFLKLIKMDFFENRVFVYTPKGDVIELPEGSSPIDFAYAIHTNIGNNLLSAKVNGKMAALNTKLQRGDIVQISTNAKSTPNRKWIELCKTAHAKKQIKNYLKAHGSTLDKLFIK